MAKKGFVILWAAVVAVAVVIALVFAVGRPQPSVSREEFLLIYENEVRPRVLTLSQDPGGDWYTEPYENTTLGEYAQELTVNALASYKAQQALFRENGLWDFTYEDFMTRWENQESDKNPYGVQVYSQYDYYVYLHSVYSLQLMQGYAVTEEDAKLYYQENLGEFADSDVWELEIWRTDSPDSKALLENAMLGEQTDAVIYEKVTLDAEAAKYYPQILALVQADLEQLKNPGQTLYREHDGTGFLIRSAGFTASQPIPYDECKDVVRNRCRQQMLRQAIAEALEDITVQQQALPAAGK